MEEMRWIFGFQDFIRSGSSVNIHTFSGGILILQEKGPGVFS
jgi:hypothetical protein